MLGQAVRYLAPYLCARPRTSPLEVPLGVGEHLFCAIVGVGNWDAIRHLCTPSAARIPAYTP